MANPILSICIPTKNRSAILEKALENISSDEIFVNTDKVEIVISDNCSDDNTQNICLKYKSMFPDKINYVRQEFDIQDKNFIEVLNYSKGKYIKLSNDKITYKPNSIKKLVQFLENQESNIIFFTNKIDENCEFNSKSFKNFNDFIQYVFYKITWIGGLCIKRESFENIKYKDRFSKLNFTQIDIMAQLSKEGVTVVDEEFMDVAKVEKYGGYNPAKVFGENLITVLSILKDEKFLTKKVYNKLIKSILINLINKYYFDYKKKYSFKRTGYFRYTYKYYWSKPYYYLCYTFMSIKYIIKNKDYHV